MIRLNCPECQSQLNAKDELAGQTRKCPKCGTAVLIPQSGDASPDEENGLDQAPPDQHVHDVPVEELPHVAVPPKLNRHNHYFICDKKRLFATWQDDGRGWLIRAGSGFAPVKRNTEELPREGHFQLVEMVLDHTDEGLRLTGMKVLELAFRYALLALQRGDNAILEKVVGPGCLNREQKNAVRAQIQAQFMPEVWHSSEAVIDYLANEDFHSSGTEELAEK